MARHAAHTTQCTVGTARPQPNLSPHGAAGRTRHALHAPMHVPDLPVLPVAAVLGVPKDARARKIKSAYRKLSLQYHPGTSRAALSLPPPTPTPVSLAVVARGTAAPLTGPSPRAPGTTHVAHVLVSCSCPSRQEPGRPRGGGKVPGGSARVRDPERRREAQRVRFGGRGGLGAGSEGSQPTCQPLWCVAACGTAVGRLRCCCCGAGVAHARVRVCFA